MLGITGSFGSGKTTVARIFKSFGVPVIDADKIAHRIIKPGSQIYRRIINVFGKNILKKNGSINRHKLARIVFDNKNLLNKINQITHPAIIRIIKNQIRISPSKIIVLDTPLLIEAGLKNLVDRLIVVKINRRQQLERLLRKSPFKKSEILKRIKMQMPLRDKIRLADFLIDNSGGIRDTKRQVTQIWKKLQAQITQNQN